MLDDYQIPDNLSEFFKMLKGDISDELQGQAQRVNKLVPHRNKGGKGNTQTTQITMTTKSQKQPASFYLANTKVVKDKNGKLSIDATPHYRLDDPNNGKNRGRYVINPNDKNPNNHHQSISTKDFNKILKMNGKPELSQKQFEALAKSDKPLTNAYDNLAFNANLSNQQTTINIKTITAPKSKFSFTNMLKKGMRDITKVAKTGAHVASFMAKNIKQGYQEAKAEDQEKARFNSRRSRQNSEPGLPGPSAGGKQKAIGTSPSATKSSKSLVKSGGGLEL